MSRGLGARNDCITRIAGDVAHFGGVCEGTGGCCVRRYPVDGGTHIAGRRATTAELRRLCRRPAWKLGGGRVPGHDVQVPDGRSGAVQRWGADGPNARHEAHEGSCPHNRSSGHACMRCCTGQGSAGVCARAPAASCLFQAGLAVEALVCIRPSHLRRAPPAARCRAQRTQPAEPAGRRSPPCICEWRGRRPISQWGERKSRRRRRRSRKGRSRCRPD